MTRTDIYFYIVRSFADQTNSDIYFAGETDMIVDKIFDIIMGTSDPELALKLSELDWLINGKDILMARIDVGGYTSATLEEHIQHIKGPKDNYDKPNFEY